MCLNGTVARRFKVHALDDSATGHWTNFAIHVVMQLPHKEAIATQHSPEIPIPVVAHQGPFELARFADLGNAQHTPLICAVHALVTAEGKLDRLIITRPTGSVSLDRACQEAISAATFIPASRGDVPVSAATDIWLNFQSPDVTNAL